MKQNNISHSKAGNKSRNNSSSSSSGKQHKPKVSNKGRINSSSSNKTSVRCKKERIQKVLANLGFGSRREIEVWIAEERIEVNGKVIDVGCHIVPQDRIKLDGRLLHLRWGTPELEAKKTTKVLQYHKPVGEICTKKDPEGRDTVFDKLPKLKSERWVAVGRLDFNTSGLLLFTNDGVLANKLLHPSSQIQRVYAVRVLGEVKDKMIANLQRGVKLEDGWAKFDKIVDAGGEGVNHWYHVTLKEGRNREVRRLWEAQGVQVSRLIRIQFGSIKLSRGLRAGKCQELTAKELKVLLNSVNIESEG